MPPKAIEISRNSTSGGLESLAGAVWLSIRSLPSGLPTAVQLVDPYRKDQNRSDDNVFDRAVEIEQRHARLERLHHQCAKHGAIDRTEAAGEGGAADDRRRDHVKLVELAQRVRRGVETCGGNAGGDAGEHAHQRKHAERDPTRVDAGEIRCFGIAADRVDVAPKCRPSGDEAHDNADAERDQHRYGKAMAVEKPFRRDGYIILLGVTLGDARRPVIRIDDEHGSKRQDAADNAEEKLGPDGTLWEAEAPSRGAIRQYPRDDPDAGENAQDPTRGAADPSCPRRAADQFKIAIHRRDGLAADHPPSCAVVNNEATQSNDEGWDAGVSDEEAVESAEQRAEAERDDHGDDPDDRMTGAQRRRQPIGLCDTSDDADEAQHRADRKVDMAHR